MPLSDRFAHRPTEQRLAAGHIARHQHANSYAALVLDGGYVERGASGRWRLEPGYVVRHNAYEGHDDDVFATGASVLNVPLPIGLSLPPVFTVAEPDELVRAARQAPDEAHRLLVPVDVRPPEVSDWPDILAARLRDAPLHLGQWGRSIGMAEATVTRGFQAAFGVTPARYRAEACLVRAVRLLVIGTDTLAQVALEAGFSDQAHLSRRVRAATGFTPSHWRKIKTVQDRGQTDRLGTRAPT